MQCKCNASVMQVQCKVQCTKKRKKKRKRKEPKEKEINKEKKVKERKVKKNSRRRRARTRVCAQGKLVRLFDKKAPPVSRWSKTKDNKQNQEQRSTFARKNKNARYEQNRIFISSMQRRSHAR